jgi:molecular chaperone DnaJ
VSSIGTHYERLGVRPDADPSQIRDAYRRLARVHHPDARGGRMSPEMPAINEAYRVLSDVARRLDYDRELRGRSSSVSGSAAAAGPAARPRPTHNTPPVGPMEPPRFPWRFLLLLTIVGSAAIIVVGALTEPGEPAAVDNVLRAGDCVVIEPVSAVVSEVRCDEVHDAVVEALIPFDSRCPAASETFRDRQGMGLACVRRV